MSSNKISGLPQLLLIADRYYADEHAIAQYGWDFRKEKLQPADSGDGLARFVAAELADVYDGNLDPIESTLNGAAYITKAIRELQALADGMEAHAVKMIVQEFLVWLATSKRKVISEGLLQSWIDVHDLTEVRDLADQVKLAVAALLPSGTDLTPEKLKEMLDKANDELALGAGLTIGPGVTPTEVPPEPPTPPAAVDPVPAATT